MLRQPGNRNNGQAQPSTSATTQPQIKVIGVGGAGTAIVNALIEQGVQDTGFIAVDVDLQTLRHSKATARVHISQSHRLLSGNDSASGRKTDDYTLRALHKELINADLVLIAADMGSETGSKLVAVAAGIARETGALLTLGLVTLPFAFEGRQRRTLAEQGIAQLQPAVDALIVISSDRLLEATPSDVSEQDAFQLAGEIVRQGIQGICELVTRRGMINLDLADLKTVFFGGSPALLALGHGEGDGGMLAAAQMALATPLTELSISSARSILFNLSGDGNLSVQDIFAAVEVIGQAAHPEAFIIFGATIEPSLGQERQIVLLAEGFPA